MKRVLQMVMALSLVSSQLFAHQAAQISRASTPTKQEVTTTQEQTTAAVTAPVIPTQVEKKETTLKERVVAFIKEHPYVTTAMTVAATAVSCYGVKYVLDGRAVSADEQLIKNLEKQEADAKAGKAGVKALTKEDEKKLAEARERQQKRNLNVVQVKGVPAKGKSEGNDSQVTPPAKGVPVKGNSAKQLEQQRTGAQSALDTGLSSTDEHRNQLSQQFDESIKALKSPQNLKNTVNVTFDKKIKQFMTQGEKPEVVGRNGRRVLKNKETDQLLLLAQLPWTDEQEQILKDQFDDVSAEYEQKPSVVNPGTTVPAPITTANVTPGGKPQESSSSDDDSGEDSSDDDSSTSTSIRSSSSSSGSDEDSDSASSDEESAGRGTPTRKGVQKPAPSAVQASASATSTQQPANLEDRPGNYNDKDGIVMVEFVNSKWQTRGYKEGSVDVQLNERIVVQYKDDVMSLHLVPADSLNDQKIQSGWKNVTATYVNSSMEQVD